MYNTLEMSQWRRVVVVVNLYIYTGELPKKSVLTNLSSKFDRFVAGRSKFDTDDVVDFMRLHVAYPLPWCVRFLRLPFVSYDNK